MIESKKIYSKFSILGAAYGLAGFIKGLGILAVKQYNVLNELTDAIQDKSDAKRREGLINLRKKSIKVFYVLYFQVHSLV